MLTNVTAARLACCCVYGVRRSCSPRSTFCERGVEVRLPFQAAHRVASQIAERLTWFNCLNSLQLASIHLRLLSSDAASSRSRATLRVPARLILSYRVPKKLRLKSEPCGFLLFRRSELEVRSRTGYILSTTDRLSTWLAFRFIDSIHCSGQAASAVATCLV